VSRIQYKAELTIRSASHTTDRSGEWNKPAVEGTHADCIVLHCKQGTLFSVVHKSPLLIFNTLHFVAKQ